MNLPTPIHGNCIQQTAYALLRGFGARLVVLKSRSIVWPVHLCVELVRPTKPEYASRAYGNAIPRNSIVYYAFETTYEAENYAPWWFVGKWRPIDPNKVHDRRRFTLSRRAGLAFVLAMIALVFVPWCIAWACYQPCFMAWWMKEALTRRRVNGM